MRVWSPGKLWEKRTVKLTEEGVFASEIKVPADRAYPARGAWSSASPATERAMCYKNVYVEDFAAPRMFVDAAASPRLRNGRGETAIKHLGAPFLRRRGCKYAVGGPSFS